MGTTASSTERPETKSGARCNSFNEACVDGISVKREYALKPSLKAGTQPEMVNYICGSANSLKSNVLPGQVESTDSLSDEFTLSDSMTYGDSIRLSNYTLDDESVADVPSKAGSEPPYVSSDQKSGAAGSIESLPCQLEKKRYPALTVCERPKRVKAAMFESLLVAVPSLKRINSAGKENRQRSRNRSNTEQKLGRKDRCQNRILEYEEARTRRDPLVHGLGSVEEAMEVLEKEESSDSFTTTVLFDKNFAAFDRQRVLSRVEEAVDEI